MPTKEFLKEMLAVKELAENPWKIDCRMYLNRLANSDDTNDANDTSTNNTTNVNTK